MTGKNSYSKNYPKSNPDMSEQEQISIENYCVLHQVEVSFVESLYQTGLIELHESEGTRFIPFSQVSELEKLARLHYQLQINIEGLAAIYHLLDRINTFREENRMLRNRLNNLDKDQ
jgi:chaperone modulatory protein CbpM